MFVALVSEEFLGRSEIIFSVQRLYDSGPAVLSVVPTIDGSPLTERVAEFEKSHAHEPAGGYGGIVPSYFNYGSLEKYFLSETENDSYWARAGGVYVLGCECGEVGCWPLRCKIRVEGGDVIWGHFGQPHRPSRDYSAFGPFVFDGAQYRDALRELVNRIESR